MDNRIVTTTHDGRTSRCKLQLLVDALAEHNPEVYRAIRDGSAIATMDRPATAGAPAAAQTHAPPAGDAKARWNAAVAAKMSGGRMNRLAAIQAVAKEQPTLYAAYIAAANGR